MEYVPFMKIFIRIHTQLRKQKGTGGREDLPCPFLKIEKYSLIWRKNAHVVIIFR